MFETIIKDTVILSLKRFGLCFDFVNIIRDSSSSEYNIEFIVNNKNFLSRIVVLDGEIMCTKSNNG
jgi:hypothetical protein